MEIKVTKQAGTIKCAIYTGVVKMEVVKPNKPYIRITLENGNSFVVNTDEAKIEMR